VVEPLLPALAEGLEAPPLGLQVEVQGNRLPLGPLLAQLLLPLDQSLQEVDLLLLPLAFAVLLQGVETKQLISHLLLRFAQKDALKELIVLMGLN